MTKTGTDHTRIAGWSLNKPKGHGLRVPGHKRIPSRTKRFAGGGSRADAVCECGWVAIHPSTQAEAADAYRGHLCLAAGWVQTGMGLVPPELAHGEAVTV